jgi:hypothetical protein
MVASLLVCGICEKPMGRTSVIPPEGFGDTAHPECVHKLRRTMELYRQAAVDAFASDDTEVYGDAGVQIAKNGAWVECWQWIGAECVPELQTAAGPG